MSKPRLIAEYPNRADDYDEAVSKSHDQNTDTALDEGGDNEVTAEDIRGHVDSTNNPHQVTAGQVGAYTKAEAREFVALPVPALPELLQVDPEEFGKALVSGYYEEGDTERAVIWEWDASKTKAADDGWSCLNPDHLSDIGTAGWYHPQGDGTDDAGPGVWVRKNIISLTVLDFGARDEEEYDNTLHFQVMADSTGYVAIPDSQYPFEIDRLVTTRPTHIFPSAVRARLKVRPESNDYCISLDHAGSGVSKGVHIDGNFAIKTPVRIQASGCFAYFSAENVTADGSAPHAAISGLLIQGDAQDAKFEIHAKNFANTGYSNESTPRVVTVQSASGGFSGNIYGKNVQCGLCLGGNVTEGDVGDLHLENAADNGIYQLGSSSILNVNSFIYRGSEEAIVAGGRQTNINSVYISGGGSACVSLMSGDLKVIDFRVDGQIGASPSNILRGRPNNVGRVEIMSLTGTIWGVAVANLSPANSVREIIIRSGDIDFLWDAGRAGSSTQWFNCENAQRFYLENFRCRIIDVNDNMPSGTIFEVRAGQPSGAGEVTVINPEFYVRQSDGDQRQGSGSVRILRPDRPNHNFIGCSFFTNLSSQPAREADYLGEFVPYVNRANNQPTGSWAENTVVYNGLGTTPMGWIYRQGSWEELINEDLFTTDIEMALATQGDRVELENERPQIVSRAGNIYTIDFRISVTSNDGSDGNLVILSGITGLEDTQTMGHFFSLTDPTHTGIFFVGGQATLGTGAILARLEGGNGPLTTGHPILQPGAELRGQLTFSRNI